MADRSAKDSANEVWLLVRDYAKQEAVDPLKGLASYTKWGVIAAVLMGIGLIELMVAVLRVAQAEGATVFDGRWSFVPYVITLAVAAGVLAAVRWAMTSRKVPVS